ncbi:NAD(P)-dependent oxidoreductase, partial [Streptomyces sp. NPDC059082]|uniref:NAD(P)-dependent oxidoreductase n=1 Tax=Streptomyces sp. NPDC059082 TaxID=3346720 RepID=UPI0036AF7A48
MRFEDTTADVWLPLPADEIEGLPAPGGSGLNYRFWDGGPEFPADPARCAFYVVPYMKGSEIAVRPLAAMTSVRVVQTLSAGIDHVTPGIDSLPPGVALCNAKGVHEASTAELTLALILASLRGIPGFVRGQDAEEWRAGFYPSLADKSVLIVGYGSIGAAIEDRLAPFECARVARVGGGAAGPHRPDGALLPVPTPPRRHT